MGDSIDTLVTKVGCLEGDLAQQRLEATNIVYEVDNLQNWFFVIGLISIVTSLFMLLYVIA